MTSEPYISSPLKNTYGEVILQKGTVLYHTSNNKFEYNSDKPMLFLTFHPSDYVKKYDGYVTKIILKKEVSLLFMIDVIAEDMNIQTALETLVENTCCLDEKKTDSNLIIYTEYLKNENFNGWFSSINRDSSIEVALINNPDVYSELSSNKLIYDWKLSYYVCPGLFIRTNWGTLYNIYCGDFPICLRLNTRYKEMIDRYIEKGEEKYANCTVFFILLKTADITYHNSIPSDIIWSKHIS